jgi:hypothetical protein
MPVGGSWSSEVGRYASFVVKRITRGTIYPGATSNHMQATLEIEVVEIEIPWSSSAPFLPGGVGEFRDSGALSKYIQITSLLLIHI